MDFSVVRDFMDRLTDGLFPGNSIEIRLRGEKVFSYQSGYSDLEEKIKMSGDELFFLFSASKLATVTSALMLHERGYFLLDDPLYEYIPEFRDVQVREADGTIRPAKNPITMRHLFTMSSGYTYGLPRDFMENARKVTDGKFTTLPFIKLMAKHPLAFDPGSDWQYSYSHDILAGAVEAISGKRFSQFVKENIFDPLEMNDSTYRKEEVFDRIAPIYTLVEEGVEEEDLVKLQMSADKKGKTYISRVEKTNSLVFGSEYDSGGAGIISSVPDYSKFMSALANGGVGPNGVRILAPGTIETLRTPHINEKQLERFRRIRYHGYTYGLGVRVFTDRAMGSTCGNVGEFGWGGAAGAMALADPSNGLSVFYTHHVHRPLEQWFFPRLRNTIYTALSR